MFLINAPIIFLNLLLRLYSGTTDSDKAEQSLTSNAFCAIFSSDKTESEGAE